MRRPAPRALIASLTFLGAAPAHAHLVETGFGAFYDGVAHVLVTPADLLVVIALALLAGQRGTRAARWALLALPAGWLAGGLLGATFPGEVAWPVLTTLTFALAGLMVTLNLSLTAAGAAAYVAGAAFIHGAVNGATLSPGGASALSLAGAIAVAICLFAIVSAQVTALRVDWTRIALRAAGSWLAAAGILMLGWTLRTAAV